MAKRLRKQDRIELLGHLMLFETCTQKELGQIASIMVEAERPAGAYLTREGQDGGLMFIIVEGTANVVAGNGKVLGRLKAGDVVGELSLIDGQARSASVVATSPVHVLEIAADDFNRLVHESPKFVKALLRSLSIRVRQMDSLTS
ncbi:MAG TPA: cyclic nucleotide-binding domain-containing protein [Acidimicrobiales bacterium]|jgi:CRP-like cAMP-binding protein|nr:cyclic nucleotide-binding domain-containing protein [Acidimicrobiales bacterium]